MNVVHTGINASLTYNTSGKSRNCKVGIDGYGVGKLYTSFVYKLRPGTYKYNYDGPLTIQICFHPWFVMYRVLCNWQWTLSELGNAKRNSRKSPTHFKNEVPMKLVIDELNFVSVVNWVLVQNLDWNNLN